MIGRRLTLGRRHHRHAVSGSLHRSGAGNRPQQRLVRRAIEHLPPTNGETAGRQFSKPLVGLPIKYGPKRIVKMRETFFDPLPGLRRVALLEIQRGHEPESGGWSALCSIGQKLVRLVLEPSENPLCFRYGLQHVFILPVFHKQECDARVKGVSRRNNTGKSIWEISYTLQEASYSNPTNLASAARFLCPKAIVALRQFVSIG